MTRRGTPLKPSHIESTDATSMGVFEFLARIAQRHGLWIWRYGDMVIVHTLTVPL